MDALRAALRREHLPANTTEEILVDELAQHFWRLRRFRELEVTALEPDNFAAWFKNGVLALVQRSMNSAERSFHKSLAALTKLQQDTTRPRYSYPARPPFPGFVPQEAAPGEAHPAAPVDNHPVDTHPTGPDTHPGPEYCDSGFVPQTEPHRESAHYPRSRQMQPASRLAPDDLENAASSYLD